MNINNIEMEPTVDAVKKAEKIAVLTGAGMSVESGVAPFRGDGGLWEKFDPNEYAHIGAFNRDPEKCWELFKMQIEEISEADPNEGHEALVSLESQGVETVITQNVDGLHSEARSSEVVELHGSLSRLRCPSCSEVYETEEKKDIIYDGEIPLCNCGEMTRPDVVMFGEMLPMDAVDRARELSREADLMMVVGTSAVVQPAASLPILAKRNGADLIEINIERTPLTDNFTDHFLKGKAGEVLSRIVKNINV
ncbi:MAG: SIR2 family NAD-dependent protein deacylase [Thermoplasmatota archaeon]